MTSKDSPSLAPAYSKFSDASRDMMQAITSIPGKALIEQSGILNAASTGNVKLLDNACGSGIVTLDLQDMLPNTSKTNVETVLADLEPRMLELAEQNAFARQWSNWTTKVVNAQDMPFEEGTFSHILTNFGVQLFPEPELFVKEAFRVLHSGGINGFTVWIQPGWVPLLQRALSGTPPTFAALNTPWNNTDFLKKTLEEVGFNQVRIEPLSFDQKLRDPEAYGRTTHETMPQVFTETVTAAVVDLLRRETEKTDGEFVLHWKALVVTATKP